MTNAELKEAENHPLWPEFLKWVEARNVHPSHFEVTWSAFLAGALVRCDSSRAKNEDSLRYRCECSCGCNLKLDYAGRCPKCFNNHTGIR
jgi:hypothetical protein